MSERKVLQTVVSARAADGGAAPTAFFLSLAPFDYHRSQLWAVMLVALGGDALSWNSGAGATSPISPLYISLYLPDVSLYLARSWNSGAGAGGGGAGALMRTTKGEPSVSALMPRRYASAPAPHASQSAAGSGSGGAGGGASIPPHKTQSEG